MTSMALSDHTWTLVTIRRVPVRVQASIVLLPLCGAASGLLSGSTQGALFMLAFVAGLYACAAIHELGHILPARAFGAAVTRIRLSGMGAFVQLDNPTSHTNWRELIISLGGPVVSAVLTVLLSAAMWPALHARGAGLFLQRDWDGLVAALAVTNAVLTLFNLLPVFPMDGGRALNALLALYLRPATATQVVSIFGQVTAVAIGGLGFVISGNLLIRGVAVLTAATIFLFSQRIERAGRRQPAI